MMREDQGQGATDALLASAVTPEPMEVTVEEENAWLRGQLLQAEARISMLQSMHSLRGAEGEAVASALGELSVQLRLQMHAINEMIAMMHMQMLNSPRIGGMQS